MLLRSIGEGWILGIFVRQQPVVRCKAYERHLVGKLYGLSRASWHSLPDIKLRCFLYVFVLPLSLTGPLCFPWYLHVDGPSEQQEGKEKFSPRSPLFPWSFSGRWLPHLSLPDASGEDDSSQLLWTPVKTKYGDVQMFSVHIAQSPRDKGDFWPVGRGGVASLRSLLDEAAKFRWKWKTRIELNVVCHLQGVS